MSTPEATAAPGWRAKRASFFSRLKPRRKVRAEPSPAAELSGLLRAFRAAALWGVAALIATATGSAFTESYRGLFEWAQHHGFSGFWAAAFPLQVDLFIAVGELVLFVAMLDSWRRRDQAGAWLVALAGLAVSVAGNVGHIAAHDLQSRGTAAVPPVAAFGALWLGLGVLKRILRRQQETAAVTARSAQAAAERDALAGVLGELSGAVRRLGEHADGAVLPPVPADAESAALASYRATYLAGNALPQRQLETRFGLTRAQAARVRDAVHAELAEGFWKPVPFGVDEHGRLVTATLNGSGPHA